MLQIYGLFFTYFHFFDEGTKTFDERIKIFDEWKKTFKKGEGNGIATDENPAMLTGNGLDYVCVSRSKIKDYTVDADSVPITVEDKKKQKIRIAVERNYPYHEYAKGGNHRFAKPLWWNHYLTPLRRSNSESRRRLPPSEIPTENKHKPKICSAQTGISKNE